MAKEKREEATAKVEVKEVVKKKPSKVEKASAKTEKTNKVQIWVKQEKLDYEKNLIRLQVELLKLQNHVKASGLKILMIFEGRDAAGKG
jgi:polyphosphate kinase 2 (PPK2 family)